MNDTAPQQDAAPSQVPIRHPERPNPIWAGLAAALPLFILAIAAWAVWHLSGILLLVFAALIVASILSSGAEPLTRLGIPRPLALLFILFVLLGTIGTILFFFGFYLYSEVWGLITSIPDLVTRLGERFGISNAGANLNGFAEQFVDGGLFSEVAGYTMGVFSVGAAVFLVLFGGAFIAFGARSYREGTLLLVPRHRRENAAKFIDRSGTALRLWLMAQFIAMGAVGLATGIGLHLLGVPSALGLGVLAGLLEFVPFVGTLVAFAAVLLVALGEGPWVAFWASVLMIAIQQVESYLLVPLLQKRAVSLPPALGLFSILIAGALFGPLGVLLATPLTILALVAVKHYYIEGVLGEKAP